MKGKKERSGLTKRIKMENEIVNVQRSNKSILKSIDALGLRLKAVRTLNCRRRFTHRLRPRRLVCVCGWVFASLNSLLVLLLSSSWVSMNNTVLFGSQCVIQLQNGQF